MYMAVARDDPKFWTEQVGDNSKHLYSTCHLVDTVVSILHKLFNPLQQAYEVGYIIFLILYTRD